jgi:glutamate-1-semialdehyde 2,1-aminomutase
MRVPGFTSTGSKRPDALFGLGAPVGMPVRLARAEGAEVWDVEGRRYLDFIMALGAVSLGYGHPVVRAAVERALAAGVVGPLAPESEERLADRLATLLPWMERTRFLKTGAEAVAAAVRLARAYTGRDFVLHCGYHGWLDWCQPPGTPGVPVAISALTGELTFGDVERGRTAIRVAADRLAAVVVEPVIERAPPAEWLTMLREECDRAGAVLVLDEIKTGFRVAPGGAAQRWSIRPDLVVLGKALANGFPLAAVGGRREVMEEARRTWISSTLATELLGFAAAEATLEVVLREDVPSKLRNTGARLVIGLSHLVEAHPKLLSGVAGIEEMCYLRVRDEETGIRLVRLAAERGLLWKRGAYNFVSLAHDEARVDHALAILDESCRALGQGR